jgi:hypothetical protein
MIVNAFLRFLANGALSYQIYDCTNVLAYGLDKYIKQLQKNSDQTFDMNLFLKSQYQTEIDFRDPGYSGFLTDSKFTFNKQLDLELSIQIFTNSSDLYAEMDAYGNFTIIKNTTFVGGKTNSIIY